MSVGHSRRTSRSSSPSDVRPLGQQLLQVALDAVLLERRGLAHLVRRVAQHLEQADLEPVLGLAGPLADDDRRRRPPRSPSAASSSSEACIRRRRRGRARSRPLSASAAASTRAARRSADRCSGPRSGRRSGAPPATVPSLSDVCRRGPNGRAQPTEAFNYERVAQRRVPLRALTPKGVNEAEHNDVSCPCPDLHRGRRGARRDRRVRAGGTCRRAGPRGRRADRAARGARLARGRRRRARAPQEAHVAPASTDSLTLFMNAAGRYSC